MSPINSEFVRELGGLGRLLSQQPHLRFKLRPGPWSFNWKKGVITANPADLVLQPQDFCRGLIAHEACHARLTRIWHMVPPELLCDPAVRLLFNAIEDCRIESWLGKRFPGTAPWIQTYNNTLFAELLEAKAEELEQDPAGAFLTSILCRWWYGRDPLSLPEITRAAFEEAWPHIQLAIEAIPPVHCPDPVETQRRYDAHPVKVCYHAMDYGAEPTPEELAIRMAQHEMCELVWRKILPVFRRLMEQNKSPLGELAKELQALRDWLQRMSYLAQPGYGLQAGSGSPNGQGRTGAAGGRGIASLGVLSGNERHYHEALARHHGAIESMSDALLRHLTAEVKMRWHGNHRSGHRLDMRRAMQFEADPRQCDSLWQRLVRPTRPDPAFVVLADASGSMEGDRAYATFEALVMLRESCLRTGIPLSILMFNSDVRCVQDWTEPTAGDVMARLCRLRNQPDGGTDMTQALSRANELIQELPHRHRHFWLLSDGEPDDPEGARRELRALQSHTSTITALGLGPETDSLRKLVPSALTNLSTAHLPHLASRLFQHMARVT
jgi:Mg-chelatase subunit ChlD